MKQKLLNIFLILLGTGLLAYLGISSYLELTNKEDTYDMTIIEACKIVEMKHSINGLIPMGTDYYYLGIDKETYDAYIIKGSKKWLEDNFDVYFQAEDSDGVKIKGLAKTLHDYDTESAVARQLAQLEGLDLPLGVKGYIDMGYKTKAYLKIIDFVLIIFSIAYGINVIKRNEQGSALLDKIWIVTIIVACVLMLFAIR